MTTPWLTILVLLTLMAAIDAAITSRRICDRLGFGKVVPVEQIPDEMEKIRQGVEARVKTRTRKKQRQYTDADFLREIAELEETA